MMDITLTETDEQIDETGETTMALASIQQHIISEEMALGEEMIALLHRLQDWDARFNLNGTYEAVGGAGEADLIGVYPHLTQSEVGNGRAALLAVITALGDPLSGLLANLHKLKG